jgi:drug/metabolite transporter (DMT)-like permease
VNQRNPTVGAVFAITGALLFGINASTSKLIIAAGFSASEVVLYRSFATSLFAFVAVAITHRAGLRIKLREWPRMLAFGVFGVALMQWAYSQAVSNLAVGIALLIEYTAIVWVPLTTWLLHRSGASRLTWIGVGFVLTGLLIVSGLLNSQTIDPLGALFAFLAAAFLTYYFIVGKNILRERDTMSTLAYSMLVSTGFWAIASGWWMHEAPIAQSVALLGKDAPDVPIWLSYRAMHHLSSTAAGIASTSETVFAFGFGFIILGETFSLPQIIGGALVLFGIVAAQFAERQHSSKGINSDGDN